MTDLVDVVIEFEAWQAIEPSLEEIANEAVMLALKAIGASPDAFEVCVLGCDDARIATLNEAFRDAASPTNVLSWPANDLSGEGPGAAPRPPEPSPDGSRESLGDVAVAYETVVTESEMAGIPVAQHVRHLLLHATFHLLGYDHETDADAHLMETLETNTLVNSGHPDPY